MLYCLAIAAAAAAWLFQVPMLALATPVFGIAGFVRDDHLKRKSEAAAAATKARAEVSRIKAVEAAAEAKARPALVRADGAILTVADVERAKELRDDLNNIRVYLAKIDDTATIEIGTDNFAESFHPESYVGRTVLAALKEHFTKKCAELEDEVRKLGFEP